MKTLITMIALALSSVTFANELACFDSGPMAGILDTQCQAQDTFSQSACYVKALSTLRKADDSRLACLAKSSTVKWYLTQVKDKSQLNLIRKSSDLQSKLTCHLFNSVSSHLGYQEALDSEICDFEVESKLEASILSIGSSVDTASDIRAHGN